MLHSFKIFQKHWQNLFCDFITNLSESEGINAVFTVVDKFLKEWHYIPYHTEDKQTSSKKTVWLFIYEVFCYYGLPQSIVSD